jgi:hypothetical protein
MNTTEPGRQKAYVMVIVEFHTALSLRANAIRRYGFIDGRCF